MLSRPSVVASKQRPLIQNAQDLQDEGDNQVVHVSKLTLKHKLEKPSFPLPNKSDVSLLEMVKEGASTQHVLTAEVQTSDKEISRRISVLSLRLRSYVCLKAGSVRSFRAFANW